ncbi:hypothetical protein CgunFtcFv8_010296 [Champsocephalus gunnari]|uniref:Uncharacterized protein n=1 Tax=Champsocephalus gunnari TaxID=52237 RepID=A0AAN8DUK8_CHAGU|nr:hypothetical protein CgunFtcFv8_010296 [Champsocephalus gunnari]
MCRRETPKALPATQKHLQVPPLPRLSLSIPAHRGAKGDPITAGIPRSAPALGLLMWLRFVTGESPFGLLSAGTRFS